MAYTKQTKQDGANKRVIFIIEDESVVRALVCKLLQEEGYQVIEAASGTEAHSVWAQKKNLVDLLVTDLVMPDGFTGTTIVEKFRQDRPTLPVIFASGYDLGDLDKELPANARFIQKPFDACDFLNLIQNTLKEI